MTLKSKHRWRESCARQIFVVKLSYIRMKRLIALLLLTTVAPKKREREKKKSKRVRHAIGEGGKSISCDDGCFVHEQRRKLLSFRFTVSTLHAF